MDSQAGLLSLGGKLSRKREQTQNLLPQHCADLKDAALEQGLGESDVEKQAVKQLGSEAEVLEAVLSRPELKSWTHRLPLISYVVGPLVLFNVVFIALSWLVFRYFFRFLNAVSEGVGVDSLADTPWWLKGLTEGGLFFVCWLLAPIFAIGLATFAKRTYISLKWPMLGALVIGFVGGGWFYTVDWQSTGAVFHNWAYFFVDIPQSPWQSLYGAMHTVATMGIFYLAYRYRTDIGSASVAI